MNLCKLLLYYNVLFVIICIHKYVIAFSVTVIRICMDLFCTSFCKTWSDVLLARYLSWNKKKKAALIIENSNCNHFHSNIQTAFDMILALYYNKYKLKIHVPHVYSFKVTSQNKQYNM